MLVDAAKQGDIEIPVFCYEPKLGEPVGACRMCLVEIEGLPKLQTACSTPIRDGMVVHTRTEPVVDAQNAVVEFLLVNHPLDCPVCDKGGECPLQDISMGWGPGRSRVREPKRHFKKPLPLSSEVLIDRERCILCYRCVRFSQEVSEDEQLQMVERGDRTYVGTFDEKPYEAPFHGNIVELCPVGALTSASYRFRARPWDIENAGSVCTLCPSQCNVSFSVRDEQVKRVLARDNPEIDDGWLCDRGRYGFLDIVNSPERLTEPLVRDGGALRPASWEEALERLAAGLRAAGSRSAAIAGGGASNEEGYFLQGILRRGLGSPHLDCATGPVDAGLLRELSRSELAAHVPDLDYAGAILVVELDPVRDAPILDLRVRKAVRRGGAVLTVASAEPTALDGRGAETVRYEPGEAAAFLGALAGALGASGHDGGGAHAEQAGRVAAILREAPETVILWGERLWSSPGAAAALLAIAEALGIAGTHGAGLIEVPVAANGRGLREAGFLPGAGPKLSETAPGSGADGIRTALETGDLDALVLLDADPLTDGGAPGWREALMAAQFVASFATFVDGAAALADVVLPLETHAEKDGTVTHPDGTVQRLRSTVPRPGLVRPVTDVLGELAGALGLAEAVA
jgi:NADH-quinone oxidoreductase subunit G